MVISLSNENFGLIIDVKNEEKCLRGRALMSNAGEGSFDMARKSSFGLE